MTRLRSLALSAAVATLAFAAMPALAQYDGPRYDDSGPPPPYRHHWRHWHDWDGPDRGGPRWHHRYDWDDEPRWHHHWHRPPPPPPDY